MHLLTLGFKGLCCGIIGKWLACAKLLVYSHKLKYLNNEIDIPNVGSNGLPHRRTVWMITSKCGCNKRHATQYVLVAAADVCDRTACVSSTTCDNSPCRICKSSPVRFMQHEYKISCTAECVPAGPSLAFAFSIVVVQACNPNEPHRLGMQLH